MAESLALINTAADTFEVLINRTNDLITALGNTVVTANTAGAVTTGNGHVNGAFSSNLVAATNLRGGNTSATTVLTIASNVTVDTGNVVLVGNSTANAYITEALVRVANSTNTTSITAIAVTVGTAVHNTSMVSAPVVNTANVWSTGNVSAVSMISTTSVNVGANLSLTTIALLSGNTIANLVANSITVQLANSTNTATLTPISLTIGSQVVNTTMVSGAIVNTANLNSTGNISAVNMAATTKVSVGANVYANATAIFVGNSTVNTVITATGLITSSVVTHDVVTAVTSGTSAQTIDSFPLASYRGGEYLLAVRDTDTGDRQLSRTLLAHDDSVVQTTEYGVIPTNTVLGVVSGTANATHVLVQITPTVANLAITAQRTLLKA